MRRPPAEPRPSPEAALFLILLLLGMGSSARVSAQAKAQAPGQTTSQVTGQSGEAPVLSLDAARKAASLARGGADFSTKLSALADALTPADALVLLGDFAQLVPDGQASKALLLRAGRLAILLGDFEKAADELEAAALRLAAARDDELILQSARCRLAAGDTDKARDRAGLVLRAAASPDLVLRARVLLVWAFLLGGDGQGAAASARSLLESADAAGGRAAASSPEARELHFILWAASAPADRAREAAILARDFPASFEALMAAKGGSGTSQGGVDILALPHWYLSGVLAPARSSPPAPSAPAPASPLPTEGAGATTGRELPGPVAAQSPRRFQLGVFSDVRNATLLVAELARKGFTGEVEKRVTGGKELFAVVVEGGEAENLLLRLKDAGYEAFGLY